MNEPKYIVGIDLGTTNSVVAYTEADLDTGEAPEIQLFEISQLAALGTVEKRNVLPSFVLVPGKHDVAEGAMALPWEESRSADEGPVA